MHRRPVYIYFLNVPSFSSRYFNKIKRTSRLGRLLTLSLEILLTVCAPMECPIKFNTVKSGWSIVYIEGLQVSLKIVNSDLRSAVAQLAEC